MRPGANRRDHNRRWQHILAGAALASMRPGANRRDHVLLARAGQTTPKASMRPGANRRDHVCIVAAVSFSVITLQ